MPFNDNDGNDDNNGNDSNDDNNCNDSNDDDDNDDNNVNNVNDDEDGGSNSLAFDLDQKWLCFKKTGPDKSLIGSKSFRPSTRARATLCQLNPNMQGTKGPALAKRWSTGDKHRGSILANHPAALGSILGILKNLFGDISQLVWYEESGQGLDNVYQTRLVLQKELLRAIVVALLAAHSLTTPEICCSNPTLRKIFFGLIYCIEKAKLILKQCPIFRRTESFVESFLTFL